MSTLRTNTLQTLDSLVTIDVEDIALKTDLTLENLDYGDRSLQSKLDDLKSIYDFGAVDGVDSSAAMAASLASLNYIYIPLNKTVIAKNIELNNNSKVICHGTLKLPNGCADFDKLLFAAGKSNVTIDVKEIDGNAVGQAGPIGTHLVYLTNCVNPMVNVEYAHDHYYPADAVIVNTDGIRDTSSGAVFLYRPVGGQTSVGYLHKWGREGVQCREGTGHIVKDVNCLGVDGGGEYSGVQVSGVFNKLINAKVDNAGASGIGFDTLYGIADNLMSLNSRENHGVNFGHPGFPATGSQASNIVVDGAYRFGISVASSTQDIGISNFTVRNCGELGISMSDGVLRGRVDQGLVEYAGFGNLSVSAAVMNVRNTVSSVIDAGGVLGLTVVTGTFIAGETVTSGGVTGVVRKVLKNRDGTGQILFLSSKVGTFVAASAITGVTSGASGTISVVRVPVAKREITAGIIIEDPTFITGGLGETTKYPDGTMIHKHTISVAATAATLASVVTGYPSTTVWVGTPKVTGNIATASSTNGFTVSRFSVGRSATDYTVHLNASVTQTYGVDIVSIGRWF